MWIILSLHQYCHKSQSGFSFTGLTLNFTFFFQEGSTVIMTLKDAGKWTILDIRLFLSVGFSLCRLTLARISEP